MTADEFKQIFRWAKRMKHLPAILSGKVILKCLLLKEWGSLM